jgi:hypothetical protein
LLAPSAAISIRRIRRVQRLGNADSRYANTQAKWLIPGVVNGERMVPNAVSLRDAKRSPGLDPGTASHLTRNRSPLSLRGRLAEAISCVTNRRQLVTHEIASAKRPRNDRMLPFHSAAGRP